MFISPGYQLFQENMVNGSVLDFYYFRALVSGRKRITMRRAVIEASRWRPPEQFAAHGLRLHSPASSVSILRVCAGVKGLE